MPQIFPVSQIARPQYYDRQPSVITAAFAGNLAPHVNTVRASYTPPSLRAAFVETLFLFMLRATAPAAPVFNEFWWDFIPAVGTTARVLYDILTDPTLYSSSILSNQSFGYMTFGDTLRLTSAGSDTGGTIVYNGSMKGTQFIY